MPAPAAIAQSDAVAKAAVLAQRNAHRQAVQRRTLDVAHALAARVQQLLQTPSTPHTVMDSAAAGSTVAVPTRHIRVRADAPGFINFSIESPDQASAPAASAMDSSSTLIVKRRQRSDANRSKPNRRPIKGPSPLARSPRNFRYRLVVSWVRPTGDAEYFDLYFRYQIAVHKEALDRANVKQFTSFLVDTPVVPPPTVYWDHGSAAIDCWKRLLTALMQTQQVSMM